VGITANGVLYVDIQRFSKCSSRDARTFYVLPPDVARIKRFAAPARILTDHELLRLFAASFHSAEYALEWLRWFGVAWLRRHDRGACSNAELVSQERVLEAS